MNFPVVNNANDTRWLQQSIETLKKNSSLSTKNIERIITDAIADYVIGTIGIFQLLEFSDALKNCKTKLTPDLKYIAEDLSQLHQYKSDKQYIHSILIDVLRKIKKT